MGDRVGPTKSDWYRGVVDLSMWSIWECFFKLYMKSSFPKRVKRYSKYWVSNVNDKFVDCVVEKSSSCMRAYDYIYIFMKSPSPKHDLWTWNWEIFEAHFFKYCLVSFGKELFIRINHYWVKPPYPTTFTDPQAPYLDRFIWVPNDLFF